MPTSGFSLNPLKVKLLAGKQKATEYSRRGRNPAPAGLDEDETTYAWRGFRQSLPVSLTHSSPSMWVVVKVAIDPPKWVIF